MFNDRWMVFPAVMKDWVTWLNPPKSVTSLMNGSLKMTKFRPTPSSMLENCSRISFEDLVVSKVLLCKVLTVLLFAVLCSKVSFFEVLCWKVLFFAGLSWCSKIVFESTLVMFRGDWSRLDFFDSSSDSFFWLGFEPATLKRGAGLGPLGSPLGKMGKKLPLESLW